MRPNQSKNSDTIIAIVMLLLAILPLQGLLPTPILTSGVQLFWLLILGVLFGLLMLWRFKKRQRNKLALLSLFCVIVYLIWLSFADA